MTDKFILVNLGDEKSKKLANVVSNETSVKILDFLGEKEEASESEISKSLKISISTIHYNLQQLKKAGLVEVKEFKWSEKGREIDLYKLAKKYIIIAPKDSKGLKTKLKGILPVALISVVIGGLIQLYNYNTRIISTGFSKVSNVEIISNKLMADSVDIAPQMAGAAQEVVRAGVSNITEEVVNGGASVAPDVIVQIASNSGLWFLVGALFALVIYLIWNYRRIK